MNNFVVLDIETENTGYDIKNDNKRIISLQLLEEEPLIYYDGSKTLSLDFAKEKLIFLINEGKNFLGFNIKNFDIPLIKNFLGVQIPQDQIIEIGEHQRMDMIRQEIRRKRPRLIEICNFLNVDCSHKEEMNKLAEKFKNLPSVIDSAKEATNEWHDNLGWSYDFSFRLALDRISGGMAILDSFNAFVASGGDKQSAFYRYAVADVITERDVFLKLENFNS